MDLAIGVYKMQKVTDHENHMVTDFGCKFDNLSAFTIFPFATFAHLLIKEYKKVGNKIRRV